MQAQGIIWEYQTIKFFPFSFRVTDPHLTQPPIAYQTPYPAHDLCPHLDLLKQ